MIKGENKHKTRNQRNTIEKRKMKDGHAKKRRKKRNKTEERKMRDGM